MLAANGLFAAHEMAQPYHVVLEGPADFAGFRRAARALLAAGVPPEEVQWSTAHAEGDLFGAAPGEAALTLPLPLPLPATAVTPLSVPADFLRMCASLALHADPARFTLIYRLLWRLGREPQLRHDPLDAEMMRARQMAGAVRRDIHKMRAFVRFRQVEDGEGSMHVAWFEPAHHIVQANAPFFARRFANLRWAIFTPQVCVRWFPTGAGEGRLETGPGARREDAPPADAGEALWLTYYSHIFNPARLKLAMMHKEMPRKYWKNLPEAELIGELTAQAEARTGAMLQAPASEARRGTRTLPAKPVPIVPLVPVSSASMRNIATLAELSTALHACRDCPLAAHATQAVPGQGPVAASLMLVGEQPGDQEDLRGLPFVGPAGQLLDQALKELGVARDLVYLTNAVKHFKYELRGKRRLHKTAAQSEAAACLHWLEREIDLVAPQKLVALGATAARALLGRPVAVTRERGQWLTRADGRRVLVTLHPSALLRTETALYAQAHAAWMDDLRTALQ